mgnify:CR=1 FL=1
METNKGTQTIIICLICTLVSCSQETLEKENSLAINPPSWIQGTWVISNEELDVENKLRFMNDAFFKIDESDSETNVMTAFILLQLLDYTISVEEFKSDSNYAIKLSVVGDSDTWYRFTRISNNEISWDNAMVIGVTDPVIYTKE